ncbi:MAG: hypothetical protein LBG83_03465 [Oscillospiraceae bacterium]|jgi:hypothetical protein|nr:hypothetical protein [Oscillospiraceae bacterium]
MSRVQAFLRNKVFLGVLLAAGFAYVTFFCFLENPLLEENTASLIGVRHPALFFVWNLLTGAAFFFNCRAMYATWQCKNRLGRIAIWAALCAVPVIYFIHGQWNGETVVFPGVTKAVHWTATIVFMVGNAAALAIGFFHARKQSPRFFNRLLALVIALVVALLVVFFTIGKSGLFEAAPIWVVYVMLFLVNCTGRRPLPESQPKQEEAS